MARTRTIIIYRYRKEPSERRQSLSYILTHRRMPKRKKELHGQKVLRLGGRLLSKAKKADIHSLRRKEEIYSASGKRLRA